MQSESCRKARDETMKKTTYISQRVWRGIDSDTRKRVLVAYRNWGMGGRDQIVGHFASDVIQKLVLVGEVLLAQYLLRPDEPDAQWDGSEWVIPSRELSE